MCGRTYVKPRFACASTARDGKTQIALRFNEAHSSGYYHGGPRNRLLSARGGSHLIIIPHIPKPAIMASQCASSRKLFSAFNLAALSQNESAFRRITVAISRKVIAAAVCATL